MLSEYANRWYPSICGYCAQLGWSPRNAATANVSTGSWTNTCTTSSPTPFATPSNTQVESQLRPHACTSSTCSPRTCSCCRNPRSAHIDTSRGCNSGSCTRRNRTPRRSPNSSNNYTRCIRRSAHPAQCDAPGERGHRASSPHDRRGAPIHAHIPGRGCDCVAQPECARSWSRFLPSPANHLMLICAAVNVKTPMGCQRRIVPGVTKRGPRSIVGGRAGLPGGCWQRLVRCALDCFRAVVKRGFAGGG